MAANNHGEILDVLRSRPADAAADLQILVFDFPAVTGFEVPNAYAMAVSAIQPFSRGSARLAGPSAKLPPVVDPNYLGDGRDSREALQEFVKQTSGPVPATCWSG